VNARSLLALFDSIYVLALAAWIGGTALYNFGVRPAIFRVLDHSSASRFVQALFPRYYAWGVTAGAIALPARLGGPLCFPVELRGPAVGIEALLLLAGTLMMLYGGSVLAPAINAARDAGDMGNERFARLHRRSVWLNAVVMTIGAALLVAFAVRPAPATEGIREPTPHERYQRSLRAYEEGRPAGGPTSAPARAPSGSSGRAGRGD
jgi:uncharacterized membrane protein